MKTLFILAGLGIFIWVLKVISDGLVDKIPKSWGIKLANAKPKEYEVNDYDDEWTYSPTYSFWPYNVWHKKDNDD